MADVKKFSFKGSAGAAKKEAGVKEYVGEFPPAGAYVVELKRLSMDENKAGPCFKILYEISEEKGSPREKYNGFGIWANQNITEQGEGYVNQFLDAISGGNSQVKEDFWDESVGVKAELEGQGEKAEYHVKRIGDFKIDSPNTRIKVAVNTKQGSWKGKKKLEVTSVIPLKDSNLGDSDGEGRPSVEKSESSSSSSKVVDETNEDDFFE